LTETNDYRRYTSYTRASNLINSFDFDRSAVRVKPQENPEERRKLRMREKKAGIKSHDVLVHEQRAARAKAIRVAVAAIAVFVLFVAVLNSFALKNQLTRENARLETDIANAQSEYISLESKLNSLVSISMIDKYAVEELGMTKVHSNQIQYMDVNEFKEQRTAALAAAEAEAAAEAAEAENTETEEAAQEADAAATEEAAEDAAEPAEDEVINN